MFYFFLFHKNLSLANLTFRCNLLAVWFEMVFADWSQIFIVSYSQQSFFLTPLSFQSEALDHDFFSNPKWVFLIKKWFSFSEGFLFLMNICFLLKMITFLDGYCFLFEKTKLKIGFLIQWMITFLIKVSFDKKRHYFPYDD